MNIARQQEGSKKAQPGLSYADISRACKPGCWRKFPTALLRVLVLRKQQVCLLSVHIISFPKTDHGVCPARRKQSDTTVIM